MNRFAISLIVFLSLAGPFISFAQTVNDLSEQKLVGRVKALTEYSFKLKRLHGKTQSELTGKNKYIYNDAGNKINEFTYNADGTLDTRSVLNYNSDSLLEQEDGYNADGSPGFTNIYKYDSRGNLESISLYDGSAVMFLKTICRYDAARNETEEINYVQEVEKNKTRDVVLNKTVWQRDEKGNITKEQYLEGGVVLRATSFIYDTKGNIIERSKTENGFTLKTTYKFDNKDRQVEETQYDAHGNVAMRITTAYDDKGDDVEENYYEKGTRLQMHTVFQYTYDKQGNWIRKMELDNNRPAALTDREIEYR